MDHYTGAGDEVFLWDVKPGRWDFRSAPCLQEYGVNGLFQCVPASPDGRLCLFGSETPDNGPPGALELVDLETRDILMHECPAGRQESTYCVAFSPDGTTFMTGHGDKVARIWDVETRSLLRELRPRHADAVTSCVFLADGKRALTCGESASIHCWDVASGEELCRYRLVPDGVISLPTSAPTRPATHDMQPETKADGFDWARLGKAESAPSISRRRSQTDGLTKFAAIFIALIGVVALIAACIWFVQWMDRQEQQELQRGIERQRQVDEIREKLDAPERESDYEGATWGR